MEMVLKNAVLRAWRWTDKASLIEQANNFKIARMTQDRFPYPFGELAANNWLGVVAREAHQSNFAIVVNGQAVGSIGFETPGDIFYRSAEIGYWLGEPYWGRGIVTEALNRVTEYAFGHFDLCRLYAGVFANNLASIRVLEKAGYEKEGTLRKSITKLGITYDQLIFAKVI